jgi:anti-sigma B factor antagonist
MTLRSDRAEPHLDDRQPAPPGVYQITLIGDVDLQRAPQLNMIIEDFRDSRHTDAEIDLRAVTFLDTAGLSLLVRLWKAARQRGGTVDLVGATGVCLRVLQATCADAIFEMPGAPEWGSNKPM